MNLMRRYNMLTLLLAITTYLSCAGQEKAQLSPTEFEQGISNKNSQLLDVRRADEYKSGHIAHALQADWNNQEEFHQRVASIDKSKPVYVYCAVGGRSKAAAQWLRTNGYTTVYELSGGFVQWKADNKPVEGMPAVKPMPWTDYTASLSPKGITLVDAGAEWCPPCLKMEPVLQQLQTDMHGKFKLLKVDAGIQTEVLKQLQATEYPTFIVYKNGKEVWRKQGIVSLEELKKAISNGQ